MITIHIKLNAMKSLSSKQNTFKLCTINMQTCKQVINLMYANNICSSQSFNSPVKNYPQRLWTSDGYQNGYYGNQHTNMGWNDYDSSIPQQQAPAQRPVVCRQL